MFDFLLFSQLRLTVATLTNLFYFTSLFFNIRLLYMLLLMYFLFSHKLEFLHDSLYPLPMFSVLLFDSSVAGDHVENKISDECPMQL